MTSFWVRTVEGLALALFLTIAILSWRLSRGPLPLDSVSPYIEGALASAQPGVELKIGHAFLNWQSLLARPTLTVEDVRAVDRRGVVAVLPRMTVRLAVAPLLRGTIAPEEISLSNPTLRVARHADGTFTFGFEPPTNAPEAAEPVDGNALAAAMVSALTQPENQDNRVSYLMSVTIEDARFVLIDEAVGRRWLVPKAALTLRRENSDVVLNATLPVVDDEKPWSLQVAGRYVAKSGKLDLSLKADGFRPYGVSSLAPQLAPLAAVDSRVSGTVSASLSLRDSAARLDRLDFDLKGEHGFLKLPAPVSRDYGVRSLAMKGSATDNFDRISLDQLRLEMENGSGPPTTITVVGAGEHLNSKPSLAMNLTIDDLTLASLKSYWPVGVKDNARNWITSNLNNGTLSQTRFRFTLAGPSLNALALQDMDGTSSLSGISVTYLKGLPPVDGTGAAMHITPGEVSMTVTEGYVPDATSGKGLRVRGGTIRMYNLGTSNEQARVILDLFGDLGEVMRLVDYKPLGYATAVGIDPNPVTGNAKLRLDFAFPLISELKLDQLRIGVNATVDGAKIPNAALGQPLTDSHLSMTLDRVGMDVKGTVALAGIPATIAWRENFGGGAYRSRYEVDAVLDNAARPLVGLSAAIFSPPYIDGPARTHMVYIAKRDGTSTIESESDLKDATVTLGQVGWHKERGTPAQATVKAKLVGNQLAEVSKFHIVSEDKADIAGSATFGQGNVLKTFVLDQGRADESNLTGNLTLDDDGVYHIDVRGSAFNSTYFWRELGRDDARGGEDKSAGKTPMVVNATFDRMWMAKDGDFRDVSLFYRQDQIGIAEVNFSSNVDGKAPFTLVLNPKEGKRTFHGASVEGGAVVRAVGLFSDLVGGNLTIDGEIRRDGSITGRADITKLKVVQAPVLARLLSVASLGGIVDQLRGGGISFDLLRVPFTYSNSQLKVHNGEMYGGAMGLTGKGTYSFDTSMMDFDGTVIPAYSVNSFVSKIPLVGKLLAGTEKGGGLVAMTYTYRGNVATAEPKVNPLAALTPGITRRIFDIFRSKPKPAAPPPEAPAVIAPPVEQPAEPAPAK